MDAQRRVLEALEWWLALETVQVMGKGGATRESVEDRPGFPAGPVLCASAPSLEDLNHIFMPMVW
jgi:hypothetical protein